MVLVLLCNFSLKAYQKPNPLKKKKNLSDYNQENHIVHSIEKHKSSPMTFDDDNQIKMINFTNVVKEFHVIVRGFSFQFHVDDDNRFRQQCQND